MSRVLVTGATGFIGRHLAPALVARGFAVRAALRHAEQANALGPGIEPVVIGDIVDPDWGPALADVDGIVHLAAIAHTGDASPEESYDRVNRWAAVDLARAASDAGARFVFMSSVRAQAGPAAAELLTESTPPAPTDAYGRAKLAAEREIAALPGPHVILRPTLVYGRGVGGNMGALIRLARLPVPLPFGAVRNARSLLAVENLVEAVALALTSEALLRGTFLVADAAPLSFAEILTHLRRGAGRVPALVPVPPNLLASGLKLVGRGEIWERLGGNLAVSTARIEALGYRPPLTSADALAALGAPGSG
jgi:nucleoside-diphosphate-sugar epimerase